MKIDSLTEEQSTVVIEILDGHEFDAYLYFWCDCIQVDGDLNATDIKLLARIAEAIYS